MNLSFNNTYPFLFIVAIIIFSATLTYFLYKSDKRLNDLSNRIRYTLISVRFIAIFLVSFFLLSPLINTIESYVEKPTVFISVDNSESIKLNSDSNLLFQIPEIVNNITNELKNDYDIKLLSFGSEVRDSINYLYNDKTTSISELFNEISNIYPNRNIGANIIISDGIFNRGIDPYYVSKTINYPNYSIIMGDTSMQRDLVIKEVISNQIVFVGNKFPVQIFLNAFGFKNEKSKLIVSQRGIEVFSKEININTNSYYETINCEIEAKNIGLQHLEIKIIPIVNEKNIINNVKKIAIDVIDSKQKILILSNSSHPDIGSIRNALNLNFYYEVEYYNIDEFNGKVDNYSMLILYQLPSTTFPINNILNGINVKKIPCLFIVGNQSSISSINSFNSGLSIIQSRANFEDSKPEINSKFNLFELEKDFKDIVNQFPPLSTPFGEYKILSTSEILMYQNIKKISTTKPLVLFNNNIDIKNGFIIGEGIWRWEITNYIIKENHDLFYSFINKIVQYLALKVNKDNFIVNHKKLYNESENIVFEAEFYNESYELTNEYEAGIVIVDSLKRKYPFSFNKYDKKYKIDAGILNEGIYNYIATLKRDDKVFTKSGIFSVLPLQVESENIIADYNLLSKISNSTGAITVYPANYKQIINSIRANENIKPVIYSEKNIADLINFKIIFFIIIFLLSLEWFLRKYNGNY